MACYVYPNNNKNNNVNVNTIADLLQKIDRMQRSATIINNDNECENCLLTSMFNTKPIAVYTCNGRATATLGATATEEANLFRVEAVRDDDTVVLRLLVAAADDVITCTAYTIVMNINCICYIQCFEPINCETTCFPVVG